MKLRTNSRRFFILSSTLIRVGNAPSYYFQLKPVCKHVSGSGLLVWCRVQSIQRGGNPLIPGPGSFYPTLGLSASSGLVNFWVCRFGV